MQMKNTLPQSQLYSVTLEMLGFMGHMLAEVESMGIQQIQHAASVTSFFPYSSGSVEDLCARRRVGKVMEAVLSPHKYHGTSSYKLTLAFTYPAFLLSTKELPFVGRPRSSSW